MADHEDYDYDDLAGVDLANLDLDAIELDEEEVPGAGTTLAKAAGFLLLLGLGALFLWLPSTSYYRRQGENSWLFFVVTLGGIGVGLLLGRWIWRWAQEAARRYAERASARQPEPERPPSALRRWATLLAIVGGGAAIVFGVPAGAYYQDGDAYRSSWFLAAGGAVVIGIFVGRWLLMQAAAQNAKQKLEPIKIQLPPWFKWVTLTALVGLGLFALVGRHLFVGYSQTLEFALGGVGFVVGVFGAIWIAKRFDELESRYRAAKRNRPLPPRSMAR